MSKRHRRIILWLTMPVVVVFAIAVVVGNVFATPPSAQAAGLICSADASTFWGLDNTLQPNHIGFRTSIACNLAPSQISVGSCLEKTSGFGTWIDAGSIVCSIKTRTNVLALGHTLWYSCTTITAIDSATYRGHSVYSVPGITPNIDVKTGPHGSRCLGPVLYKVS
jgi:hypothetical protein